MATRVRRCNCCAGGVLEHTDDRPLGDADYEDRVWYQCQQCREYNARYTGAEWELQYMEHDGWWCADLAQTPQWPTFTNEQRLRIMAPLVQHRASYAAHHKQKRV